MKIAIYGQYYLNSVEPIKEIFSFFNSNKLEIIIEANFLKVLYEKNIIQKEYKTFSSHTTLDHSFDMLISIGGDGTILRAATLVRDSGVPILGINAGRLGFLATVQKENIASFMTTHNCKEIHDFKKNLIKFNMFARKRVHSRT